MLGGRSSRSLNPHAPHLPAPPPGRVGRFQVLSVLSCLSASLPSDLHVPTTGHQPAAVEPTPEIDHGILAAADATRRALRRLRGRLPSGTCSASCSRHDRRQPGSKVQEHLQGLNRAMPSVRKALLDFDPQGYIPADTIARVGTGAAVSTAGGRIHFRRCRLDSTRSSGYHPGGIHDRPRPDVQAG